MISNLLVLLCSLHLSQAVNLYLSPPRQQFPDSELASTVLAEHLGLEILRPLRDTSHLDYFSGPFVGSGTKNAVLLIVDNNDAHVIPEALSRPHSFALTKSSASAIITSFNEASSQVFASVYSESLTSGYDNILAFFDANPSSAFAALHLSNLADLRNELGIDSEDYLSEVERAKSFLHHLAMNPDTIQLAVLTHSEPASVFKRQAAPLQSQAPFPNKPLPQEPIGSVSTCFSSVDVCNNSTSTCSGKGQCVKATKAGRSCFVCACGVTKTGKGSETRTQIWVGESCERQDVSSPFVLLAGTTLVLILLVSGAISLLYSIGNAPLPSTLLAGAVNSRKDS